MFQLVSTGSYYLIFTTLWANPADDDIFLTYSILHVCGNVFILLQAVKSQYIWNNKNDILSLWKDMVFFASEK